MKKKSVTMIVSVVCLAGLTAGYISLKNYNEAEEAKEALGEEVWEVDKDQLTGIAFSIEGTEYHFVKEDGSWNMSEDDTFPVNETVLMTAMERFSPLKVQRTLTDAEDTSEYGMDDPQNVITLTMEDGSETVITIGDTNEGTQDDYLMLSDTSSIYTVEASIREAFASELYDYAKSETFPSILADDVTAVSVTAEENSFELVKDGENWNVTADGVTEAAYESYVNQLLSEVSGLGYVEFVEHNCQDLSPYGLEEPQAVVTITWLEEEEEQSMTLYVGGTDDSENYYTQLEDSKEVHTMSSITMGDLLEYDFESLIEPETETESETEDVTEAAELLSETESESDS